MMMMIPQQLRDALFITNKFTYWLLLLRYHKVPETTNFFIFQLNLLKVFSFIFHGSSSSGRGRGNKELNCFMSPLSLLSVVSFWAYFMSLAKGLLSSLILSGVSRQVSSICEEWLKEEAVWWWTWGEEREDVVAKEVSVKWQCPRYVREQQGLDLNWIKHSVVVLFEIIICENRAYSDCWLSTC